MASDSVNLYRKLLIARMKKARKQARMSQREVAESMLTDLDTYKKWEQRGALPTHMVERFANTVHADVLFILTGRYQQEAIMPPAAPAATALRKRA